MKIKPPKFSKNRNMTTITIAFLLIVSMAASITLIPSASAHSPPWQIPTHAYIWVEPNPIGVGQQVTVYMWLNQVYGAEIAGDSISYAQPSNNYRFHDYNLTITLPDGTTKTTIFDEISDPTSSQYTKYTPTEVGTYTFTFTFPGQVYGANDGYSGSLVVNDTYLPSSASQTLTVQQTPIAAAISSAPMPTAYWMRPIYGANTDWYTISSNWLGSGAPVNSATGAGTISAFLPTITRALPDTYIQTYPGDAVGPLTSHVMWTYPIEEGGIVGGNNFPTSGVGYFEGSAYEQRFTNPIIIYGTIYYTMPVSFSGVPGGLFGTPYGPTVAQSLITGQILWSRTDVPALSFGYIYDVYTMNQHGVYPAMLVATSGGGFSPLPPTWQVFDAYTGNWLFNATNIPNGLAAQGPSGEQLRYVFANAGSSANPDWRLGEWNSSKLWSGAGFTVNASVPYAPTIMGPNRVVDASISNPNDVNSRYDWNVSVPWYNPNAVELAALDGNVLLCMNGSYPVGTANMVTGYFSWAPYTYFAVNLNASRAPLGQVLWSNTINPSGNLTATFGGVDPTVNVFVETYRETSQFVGYSLTTGQKLWGPTASQVPFDYYGSPSAGTITDQLAYGRLYSSGYAGIIYTYDLANGNLLWTYGNGGEGNSTNAGLNTPYGDYPTFINAVGNGVLYLVATEHTITDPIWKGAMARAINATTGQEIWTLSDFTSEFGAFSYAIADGYATWFNGYDDSVYSVGRGPSATTVSAPSTGISFGTPLVIKGTVMDISAGTQQPEQKADFPNGVPVASDASMSDWMSYVYQQQPLSTNFAGVPVTISVLDSNGNYRSIGTATTDASGSFSLTWTPDIPGNFTVFANFAGTNGYWPSSAENAFTVMQAEKATPTSPQANIATTADLTSYFVGAVIAIIAVIIVVGALIMLTLKKRA